MSGVGGFGYVLWVALWLCSDDPDSFVSQATFCDTWTWLQWFCYPSLVVPYVLRTYRISKIFNVRPDQQVVNPKYWDSLVVRELFLFQLYLVVVAVLFTAKIILFSTHVDFSIAEGYGCRGSYPVFWMSLHLAEIVLGIYAIYRLKNIRDDYGISCELTAVSAVWIVATVAMFVTLSLRTGSLPHEWFSGDNIGTKVYEQTHAAFANLRNMVVFVISVAWPLVQTYSTPFVPLWSNCDALRELDSLLKDIVCIQYFRKFLASTRSGQHERYILCWVEIELYKDMAPAGNQEALVHQATRILEKYVRAGSELEVQCSAVARQRAMDDIRSGAVTSDTFTDVQHDVFEMMRTLFPTFLASESCRECLTQLEQEEHLREILEKSDMI